MDRVEFNGNEEITIDEIYNFIVEKLLTNINSNSLITLEDIKDILEKIKKITNGRDIVTDDQLLEIIKILLPYKIMNYFGGQVIHKYYDVGRNQFFKFKIIDGQLYLYDNNLTKERQRKIKVEKINEIDIETIINKLNIDSDTSESQIENILMHPELLKAIGIDTKAEYNLTLLIDETSTKHITLSLSEISENPNFIIFEKEYEPAKILSREHFQMSKEDVISESYSKKLIYSYDSCQKLLQMLLGFCKSNQDVELFNEVIKRQLNYNIKSNSDEYLDWMFISSFFLFNEQKIRELSDNTYDNITIGLANYYNCYYLDKNNEKVSKIGDKFLREIGYNKALINEQTHDIDYKKLIKQVRNALAHSSYEVIDENYIRCYGTNFNVIVNKKFVMRIISELIYNTNLDNLFPLFYMKESKIETYYKSIENEEELRSFLKNISFISIEQVDIKKHSIDNEFKEIIRKFKINRFFSTLIGTKKIAKLTYNNSKMSEFVQINFPEDGKDNEVDVEYVLKEVRKYGDDFYKHSLYNQYEIIKEIIREKELSEKGISPKLFNIIQTKEKASGNIIDTIAKNSPIEYINYGKYIQATFIAYLNSLLLYPYNGNERVDYSELTIDTKMNISSMRLLELKNNKREKNNLTKEKQNLQQKLTNLKARLLKVKGKNQSYEEQLQEEIKKIEDGTYESKINESLNNLNRLDILNSIFIHLRDSLAHGRITFPYGFDFNNIGNTIIRFEDYDKENIKTFDATIKLSDLLLELSKEKFLLSIFPQELSEEQNRRRNA